ncbi:MAG TPA: hypothetical protein VIW29_21465, partial [Polyangiaceae bacterium]
QYHCEKNVLTVCNSGRTGYSQLAICDTEALCNDTEGKCDGAACAPDQYGCQCAMLGLCNGAQNGYNVIATCVTPAHCRADLGMCTTAPCTPNEYQCNGAELRKCQDDQLDWEQVATCDTAALCDQDGQQCDPPACTVGSHYCDGAQLQVCNPERTAFVDLEACDSTELCDQPLGRCNQCVPGTYDCQGDDLHLCDDDGQANPLALECEPGRCFASGTTGYCYVCDADEHRCTGSLLEVCNPERLGFALEEDCVDPSLCMATGSSGSCLSGGGGAGP